MSFVSVLRKIQRSITRDKCFTCAFYNLKTFSSINNNKKDNVKKILETETTSLPKPCTAEGWVSGLRKHKEIRFLDLSDGSCNSKLQIVLPVQATESVKLKYGDAITVNGQLNSSSHPKQRMELHGDNVTVNGSNDPEEFPLKMRQKYPIDQLRHQPHFRPKHKIFQSLLRVRNTAAHEIHNYLQTKEYVCIHAPIITSNDCEGAGEVFSIQSANKKDECKKDSQFFDKPVFLSVSSQLHLEAAANALKRVYAFGPTFRAENTRTRQHLSEFHMLEVEEAFVTNVDTLTELLESMVKHVGTVLFDKCSSDIEDLHKECAPEGHLDHLKLTIEKPFQKLTYCEAVEILQNSKKIEIPIKWGDDLLAEHEQHLVKHFEDHPVIVTHYPSKIKPFYMKTKENNTKSLAECFDVLVPLGGELCGGSLREDQYDVLKHKLKENGNLESLNWYLELRKFGCPPHGGFGLGFDRLLQYLLGIRHIRDVVPFPRWTHHCVM